MRNTNSTNGKPDKFDMFDAPKYYSFSKNKSKSNPRQTSINRQSQLDRWFTIIHVEEPSAIRQIKLSQQQKKRSINSKVSNNQKNTLNIKQMKNSKKELNNKKQSQLNQNDVQVNKKNFLKKNNNQLKDEKILKKHPERSKNSKNIFQNKQPSNKSLINIQKIQENKQIRIKRDELIKQYQVPKPIKLSKPKFSINQNQQNQKQSKFNKKTSKNQITKTNTINLKQHYSKNVSAPKSMTVFQATTDLVEKNLKSKSMKSNGPHPCQYPIRIQRQWEIKYNKKWYSLSEQSKKKAQESMKKMKRQTRPKVQQTKSNKYFCDNNNIKKPSTINTFNKNKIQNTKQFDL